MTTKDKIARRKLSLLELASDLANVSRACKLMGYSRQLPSSSTLSKTSVIAFWTRRILLITVAGLYEADGRSHDEFAPARLLVPGRERALAQ
jgi:hypothetical protein